MRKLLLFLLLFPLWLFAAEKTDNQVNTACDGSNVTKTDKTSKVEIYASHLNNDNGIVKASGDVVVLYKDYYLSAKDAVYDRANGTLELYGNVRAMQGGDYQLLGDYARLNISKKEKEFKPFYLLEQKSQVWLSAKQGNIKDKDYDITTGMISGCNPNKPLWKIEFSSSDYNSDTKWMNLYNARLYIYDIPILYIPYFGYSLDTTRRSGLLIPQFGISSDEGFFYRQPIYIAVQNWWDLELDPQVRSSRGYGSYETFRFVDSKSSYGSITTGYFKEQQSYVKLNDLAHTTHYGVNFNYDNSGFLNRWFGFDLEGQSGMYADISWMNDVDYINLASSDTLNNATSNQILSQVNLFYNTNRNYVGTYFKYYQDLSKESNAKTLQKLPTLQYHNYLTALFNDHVTYDVDFTSTYLYREQGKNSLRSAMSIPLGFQTSLFDEYANFSYESQLYGEHITFNKNADTTVIQNPDIYRDGVYLSQYNVFDINTNLTKAYDSLTHTIVFDAKYIQPGSQAQYGFFKARDEECSVNPLSAKCADYNEFYDITPNTENAALDMSQYLFDENGLQFLYHRLSQQIYNPTNSPEFRDIENELDYKVTSNFSYYNDTFYNYQQKLISKTLNTVSYNNSGINLSLSYLYKDSFKEPLNSSSTPRYTKYLTSSFSYKYNDHYNYFGNYNYDVQAGKKKSSEIGFLYSKRCWDFGLRYVENIRPILTAANQASSIADRYIFFTITLKPIGGSEINYRIPKSIKAQ